MTLKKNQSGKSSLQSAPVLAPNPALIDPFIMKLSGFMKSGKATPSELAKPYPQQWPRVTPALLSFLESEPPDLRKLAEILKAYPVVYWHPLVQRQVTYLARLRYDQEEWHRLQWEPEWDEWGGQRPPKEVESLSRYLKYLVESHASGLCGGRIIWKSELQRPGPKGALRNPHPGPGSQWIEAEWLDEDFRSLRSAFKAKLSQRASPHLTKAAAKDWYSKLAQDVLEDTSDSDSVGWWSERKEYREVNHSGQESRAQELPSGVSKEDLFDGLSNMVSSQLDVQWKPLKLDPAIEKMLAQETGRAGGGGRPAYLAYSVLGALLEVGPEKISDMLDNYVHRRRRKPSR